MARPRERLFGIEDWLAHAGEPDVRYELIDGVLVAMNPPKEWHGTIANQIGAICARALEARFPCRAQQQAGIEIRRATPARGYIADVAVTCEPIAENRPLIREPRLIVEIVSPSTDRYDKTEKLATYKALPSVEEVWLVWSTNRLVVVSRRDAAGGWRKPEAYIGQASFASGVLGVEVALDDLYRFTTLIGSMRLEPEVDGNEVD